VSENTAITPEMAQAEIDRRAANKAAKAAARKQGAKKFTRIAATDPVLMALSGEQLDLLVKPAEAQPEVPTIKTAPAWNEPGVRGGDPVKRNRALLADKLVGADSKGTPAWWDAYRSTKDMTLDELGVALGFITA
jgi:hypothetical protein